MAKVNKKYELFKKLKGERFLSCWNCNNRCPKDNRTKYFNIMHNGHSIIYCHEWEKQKWT